MRVIAWLIRILVFLVFLGFALENTEPVIINLFLGYYLEAPLVAVLLAVLLVGSLIGVLFMLPGLLRHRRVAARLRREVARAGMNAVPKESEAQAMAKPKP